MIEQAHSIQVQHQNIINITEKLKDIDENTCADELVKLKKEYIQEFSKANLIIMDSNEYIIKKFNELLSNVDNRNMKVSKDLGMSNEMANLACDMILRELEKDGEVNAIEVITEVCEDLLIDIEDIEKVIQDNHVFQLKLANHLNNNNICTDLAPKSSSVNNYF